MTVGEDVYYYHTDASKNVLALTDSQGNVVETNEYSPFGKLIATTGNLDNPFKFSSEYYDSETELVYYNYRYYNPPLGRWLSRDPIEEQGGYNLYGMIENNPLDGWDELGYGTTAEGLKLGGTFGCMCAGFYYWSKQMFVKSGLAGLGALSGVNAGANAIMGKDRNNKQKMDDIETLKPSDVYRLTD